jgi:alginate O-acetyltransferase complex protein AlgI
MKALIPLFPALIVFPIGLFLISSPAARFLWGTAILLFLLKVGALIRNHQQKLPWPRGCGWVAYLFLWPGMRPESFSVRKSMDESVGRGFVIGFVLFILGLLGQLLLTINWTDLNHVLRLYLGLASFLLIVHFGVSAMLFTFFRLVGYPVEPLFKSPFASASLREFWGQRWNLAFVDMDKRLFLPLFPRGSKWIAMFGIFLVSGILHEFGISYPAGGGWGGPLLYFLIHGVLTAVEPSLPLSGAVKRFWVWITLLLPVPLLFHMPFLKTFVQPYFEYLNVLLHEMHFPTFFCWIIITAGLGHLLILAASFQVPGKLGWKEDFGKLSRFNQKIFWTYGGYIVFCILSFAAIDVFNSAGLIERNPSSLAIALFIALFWSVRLVVDFGYFKHDDWPRGDQFIIGHACLSALFLFLAVVHWGLVIWQLANTSILMSLFSS